MIFVSFENSRWLPSARSIMLFDWLILKRKIFSETTWCTVTVKWLKYSIYDPIKNCEFFWQSDIQNCRNCRRKFKQKPLRNNFQKLILIGTKLYVNNQLGDPLLKFNFVCAFEFQDGHHHMTLFN